MTKKKTYTRRAWAVVYRSEPNGKDARTSENAPLFSTKKLAMGSAIYMMFRGALKIVPATITYSL